MPGSVFVSGARTPIGRFNGGLANFTGAELDPMQFPLLWSVQELQAIRSIMW